MPAVSVDCIKVLSDRIVFDVSLADDVPRHTDAHIARRAVQRRPRIVEHTCVNSTGEVFGDVIEHTPLPHLLEHLAIDIAVDHLAALQKGSAHSGAAAQAEQDVASRAEQSRSLRPEHVITGMSEWIDREQGSARVTLSCPDDLLVLQSFNEAVALLDDMVVG